MTCQRFAGGAFRKPGIAIRKTRLITSLCYTYIYTVNEPDLLNLSLNVS